MDLNDSCKHFIWSNKCDILLDENYNSINIMICGNKSGLCKKALEKIRKVRKKYREYKFLSNCSSNAFTYRNDLTYSFDGLIDPLNVTKKSLKLSMTFIHSLRSIKPTLEFYNNKKTHDFFFYIGSLTIPDCKGIKTTRKFISILCDKNLKGIVVSEDYVNDKKIFRKYIKAEQLKIYNHLDQITFFQKISMCKISIFPNIVDAFPKLIIESLLLNNVCIVNEKLLMGLNYLKNINSCFIKNFNKNTIVDTIETVCNELELYSPREEFLEIYSSTHISKIWAKIINKKFNKQYKQIFHLKYINYY